MSILIIDDHPRFATLMRYMLAATTYGEQPILTAQKVEDVEAAIEGHELQAVFLDNYVPPHTSFRTSLKILRPLTEAPIILLSGSDAIELGIEVLPPELAAFVLKDQLTKDILQCTLDEVLKR